MKRMKLDLEDLVVDSFETDMHLNARGTVHGHGPTHWCTDGEGTCGEPTCGGVAENTCALSCDTCDQYRCGTIQGYDCTNMIGCASDDGQCQTGTVC